MTYYQLTKEIPVLPHRQRPISLFRRLAIVMRHKRDYRKLQDLPDYLLDDVGLTRSDIKAASKTRLF
jgi:uncharacterized protein YjiS (DUF1127 family)